VAIVINQTSHTCTVGGIDVRLLPNEFALLTLFMANKNVMLSRRSLFQSIWGMNSKAGERTLDVNIARLRKKLRVKCIETVPCLGYKYVWA
jgi:DNA-binding response OmpR family regulator